MGTSICCLIPKEKDYSIDAIEEKLNNTFVRLKTEFIHSGKQGAFSENLNGNWWISIIPSEDESPEYITGEGGGFNIDIYKNVIHIGCVERFSSLYLKDEKPSIQLLKIITELSHLFRSSEKILIGASGTGETDHIMDMAFYESANFEQVYMKMTELNGVPARFLTELKDRSWYLKKQ